SDCLWESLEVIFCAADWSSQRSGAVACCESSAMSRLMASTSLTASMDANVERRAEISAGKSREAMEAKIIPWGQIAPGPPGPALAGWGREKGSTMRIPRTLALILAGG